MANTVWAFAKLSITNEPFFDAISAASLAKISHWDPQAVANLAWSDATINRLDEPLLAAISAAAIRPISQFATQNLSNIVWAYATLKVAHGGVSPHTVPHVDERGHLPSVVDFSDDGDDMLSFTAEEISEALEAQNFKCARIEISSAY